MLSLPQDLLLLLCSALVTAQMNVRITKARTSVGYPLARIK